MSGSSNKHARLSPSGAERWADCTASISFCERLIEHGKIPEREPDNVYAIAGTFAHDMAEDLLNDATGKKSFPDGFKPLEAINDPKLHKSWLAKREFHGVTDKEILAYMKNNNFSLVQEYVDYCMSQIENPKDRTHIEVKSPLFYEDNANDTGTCDWLIEHKSGKISVTDLKWRRSGMVESVENYQLSIYTLSYIQNYVRLGFMKEPNALTEIEMATFNPLVPPFVKPWITTYGELKKFCQRFHDAVDTIKDGTFTVFVPTEKGCKWCPAAKHNKCPALNAKVQFALPNTLDIEETSDENLAKFFNFYPEIEAYFKRVHKHLLTKAEAGQAVEGTKLVQGRKGNTAIENEEVFVDFLKESGIKSGEIYKEPQIKTATQLLDMYKRHIKTTSKLSGKDLNEYIKDKTEEVKKEYTYRPEGKKVLTVDSDERQTVGSVKSLLFKGVKK